MANRVSSAEVLAIMDLGSGVTDVDAFILSANMIVTDKLAGQSLGDARLKEIERWLSAHFVSIKFPRLKSEKADGAADVYDVGQLGKGLQATAYGQQVLLLDTTGIMAGVGRLGAFLDVPDFREA